MALPCFHLIARAFPGAERRLLTSLPRNEHAVPLSALLEGTSLVQGYFTYASNEPGILSFLKLWNSICVWRPDLLIYLAEPQSWLSVLRDALFFRSCGIRKIIGLPQTAELRRHQWIPEKKIFEYESERLSRCLEEIGNISLTDPSSWDLELAAGEERRVSEALKNWPGEHHFVVCAVGAKTREKDWGRENWKNLFLGLGRSYPNLGLVMVGAEIERKLSEAASSVWEGPMLNLCGRLSVRESAALMKRALFFLGHDSGPMHLAAAAGTSCVSIFVECKKPGVWFPYGTRHHVLYAETRVGGEPTVTVREVLEAVRKVIEARTLSYA